MVDSSALISPYKNRTAAAIAHALAIGLGMVASLVLCVVARR